MFFFSEYNSVGFEFFVYNIRSCLFLQVLSKEELVGGTQSVDSIELERIMMDIDSSVFQSKKLMEQEKLSQSGM